MKSVPNPDGWTIRCSWCSRRKDADGAPIGPPLPQGACHSDGICTSCEQIVRAEIEQMMEVA